MPAVREQIFAAIETALAGVGGAAEVLRMPPGDPATFPAVHIFDEGQEPEEGEAGTERFALNVGIDGYVQQADGAAAHTAIHALYAAVIEALFPQPYLGGLVEEIDQGRLNVNVAERASKRRMAFSLDLTIHYATRRGSPQVID
ncbi:MAG: hypothetical protein AB7G24_00795 [Novosphingobium sp.]